MKTRLGILLLLITGFSGLNAQRNCATPVSISNGEFINENTVRRQTGVIKIPVVVHILYHEPTENITDQQVYSQIEALNRDFRRRSADTINTPAYFKQFAADCEIEFQLAISDPQQRSTTGITRTYTPIKKWNADDQMKSETAMGVKGWDSRYYLNIWVCNLDQVAGYASLPGGPADKDGIVIDNFSFGTINIQPPYNLGKTVVHEVGHWLNLKHIWGDEHCGDDLVYDTPRQSVYTIGCPSGIRISCDNGPYGNMYMNYMDFTEDACMNMFTIGQKERMRRLFAAGGARQDILSSKGLNTPLIFETPIPQQPPKWLFPKLYPIPSPDYMQLDVAYDTRWIGKTLSIFNMQGQIIMQVMIRSTSQQIDIRRLQAGSYILIGKKDDGEMVRMRFVKL
jgi:hypothetical protein